MRFPRLLEKARKYLVADEVVPEQRPGMGRHSILAHAVGPRAPEVPYLIVPDLHPTERDVQFADRLLKAYARATADEAAKLFRPGDDLWTGLRALQANFLAVLAQGDPSRLAEYLCNMGRLDATVGTVQGHLASERIRADRSHREFLALMTKDKLVSLAEAIGAIPCENPEQGPWAQNLHLGLAALVEKVEQALGLDVAPPPIDGGLLKLDAGHALFHERDLNGLYTAWALKRLLPPAEEARVCEIGGGSGRVAYWSSRFGVRSYTIFDLPHINVVQGYYLLKALPAANIILYGEPGRPTGLNRIDVLPYFCTNDCGNNQFDLVLNQDSFPEIDRDTVLNYLAWIKKSSRRFFLSINQESRPPLPVGENVRQLNVPELVAETGGFHRVSRDLYWLRKGYVAELYAIAGKSSDVPARPVTTTPPTVFHITHWKAGSQWINRILHALAFDRIVLPTKVGQDQFLLAPIQPGKVYPTVYVTQEQFNSVAVPQNHRRFVIIRDLRDTLVSLYFSAKVSHEVPNEEVACFRATLRALDQEAGMLHVMEDRLPYSSAIQESWVKAGETLLRYEDLLEDDLTLIEQLLLQRCELPVTPKRLREVVRANRFERLTGGRQHGQEDISAHERKGVPGDWRTYFTNKIKSAFKARFGQLLIDTGYEHDLDW